MADDPSAKPPLLLHQHGRGEMHRGGPPGESVSARTLSLGCLAHLHHSII